MQIGRVATSVVILTLAVTFGACAKSKPPVARPFPPPPADPATPAGLPPKPPEPVAEPVGVPPEPRIEDPLKVSDIDKINQNSPFTPVFFRLRQLGDRCRGAEGADGQRGNPEEVSGLGDHD